MSLNTEGSNVGLLFVGVFAGIILTMIIDNVFREPYKHGQIDALTGNIKYELIENSDSTKTWERINEPKNH